MSLKKYKFSSLFNFQNKSGIMAGDGLKEGAYPFFTSSSIQSKYLNEYSFDNRSLIFGTGGNASIHFCENPFSVSTDCLVAVSKDEKQFDPKFVFYYLFGNINLLEAGFKGAGLKHISKTYINDLEIPLPPLPIQKRIAEILDAADALKRKDQELLKKYDELAQAIFIDMFGDPVKNEMGWEEGSLNEVLEVDAKAVNPNSMDSYNYVGLEHIEKETGKILTIDKGDVVSNKFLFTKNHILYGKLRPYLNKVATPDFNGICSTDIFPLLPKKEYMKQFLVSILRSKNFVNHSNTNAVGANLPRANKEIVLSYKTIIPDEKTIKLFSSNIKLIEAQKQNIENQIINSGFLFKTLIQKAFNGELVR